MIQTERSIEAHNKCFYHRERGWNRALWEPWDRHRCLLMYSVFCFVWECAWDTGPFVLRGLWSWAGHSRATLLLLLSLNGLSCPGASRCQLNLEQTGQTNFKTVIVKNIVIYFINTVQFMYVMLIKLFPVYLPESRWLRHFRLKSIVWLRLLRPPGVVYSRVPNTRITKRRLVYKLQTSDSRI